MARGHDVSHFGFKLIEDLSPAVLQERYFQDRSDGFRAAEHFHFVRAHVQ
jgi:hypothetical protein